MEDQSILYPSLPAILFLAFMLVFLSKTRHKNLSPSPPSLSIISHLHLLKTPTHRALLKLPQKYGPIISLKLGSHFAVLVSSASVAEECFTKNDIILAKCPKSLFGTDTSAMTLEWAMANLLNHSKVLKKAREEINSQLGDERLVEESDAMELQYLQNIISKTLRLYPGTPLLIRHLSSADCIIRLAKRVVSLALGSIIQCFEWERVSEGKVNMTEGKGGATMPKAQPLEAMCKARSIVNKLLCGVE
ncbi:hypothetical protein SLEP1_g27316 [Rubroshorea leprosula]|uniref:Cytochrome P450 n=1 Tax=Rubroshorea leprosula TaxID=152421 RepID=A0AAV5JQ59_9ROSI|nr:hypothetical protein SLEP1_g27316 [Rubroshorea leprosula]